MNTLPRILGVNGASGKQRHLCPNCGAYVIAQRAQGSHNAWSCRTRSISSFSINFQRFNSAIFKSSVELCANASTISCSSALCCRSSSAR